jgi:chromosome segregation protein
MRLKSIKLAGFKSFVDPTTVQFPGNMCAVVGPNGCGKSNIIDAVRWVMGESSAKTLRGESMTDVIFNGTSGRQPVSQASIELVFDNAQGKVTGEFAAYNEISVRRVVTREAQSEYYLNGAKCRRRDITDLFLGTGLGPRSYAIIEQGVVSRLIESKPEELRVFIEEAAGISKYKERRRETESRMRRTTENLERLTDLRDELQRNLAHLDRQARAAERYADLRAEERVIQSELYAIQWRDLNADRSDVSGELAGLDIKREAAKADVVHVVASIEAARSEQVVAADALTTAQETFYTVGGEVTRVEQALRFAQDRRGELKRDLEQTRTSLEQTRHHLEADQKQLHEWDSELTRLEPALAEHRSLAAEAARALSEADRAVEQWSQTWDSFNEGAQGPSKIAEVQQSRIVYLEQVLNKLQERRQQLQAEQASLDDTAEASAVPYASDIEQADRTITELEAQIATFQRQLSESQTAIERSRVEQDDVRASIQEIRGQIASLNALQQATPDDRERIALDDWIASSALSSPGGLYTAVEVESGWDSAVEQVLAEKLSALLIADADVNELTTMEVIPAGAFLLSAEGGVPAPTPGTLASQVKGPPSVMQWLSSVRTAIDLEEARALLSTLEPQESVVTKDGHWLGRDWYRRRSDADPAAGVIARQAHIDTLSEQLEQRRAEALRVEDVISGLLQQRSETEKSLTRSQQRLQAAVNDRAEWVAEHRALATKMEQQAQRFKRLQEDIAESERQYDQEQANLAEARTQLSSALDQMEIDRIERERLQSERERLAVAQSGQREASRLAADELMRSELQGQSLATQTATLRETISRMESQLKTLESRETELHQTLPAGEDPDAENKAKLSELLEQRVAAEAELNSQRMLVGEIDANLRGLESRRLAHEQSVSSVQSEMEQLRLREAESSVRLQTLEQEIAKRDVVLQEVVSSLPEGADEAEWMSRVERAANRISRLGPINLAAIDEHARAAERKHYLDAQNEDLESALGTLRTAIRKIDKETRQRFKDTFDQINVGFAQLFPRVFGGGTAALEMTGDDLLDTGVAIFARPPGKKNSTIHLLSGGEKAMTAIALVFSIFQLNPAPFCMLDEVDAPLDDANVGRYARLVREMSEKVQFVFITHNKITMESADQLMGVTMHEPGVSRLVSVDVEEAAQLAAS